jgi:hypothetical protein
MKLSLAICFSSAGAAFSYQNACYEDVPLSSRSKLSLPDDYAALFQLVAQAIVCSSIRFASLLAPPGR